MKKKVVAVLLSVAMVASLAVGCGGTSSEKKASGTSATENVDVSKGDPQLEKTVKILSIWDKDSDNGVLINQICDDYKEENPNFDYEYEYVSADDLTTKIATLAASNDLPDFFAYESGTPLVDYIETEKVVDISEVLEQFDCEDSMNESAVSLLSTLTDTDDFYALPLGLNVEGFWYNKEAFAKAGIDSAPATWEEFEAACQKLQDAGIQPLSAGGSDKWGVTRLINAYLVRTSGKDAMKKAADGDANYTDEEYVAAAQKIQDWADKGWFGTGVNTVDMTTAGDMMMGGQAGIFYNGSWFTMNLNDETENKAGQDGIGFFNVPVADEKISSASDYSMNCGNVLCASSDKYDEATGWFIKYFVENMGDIAMEKQGSVKGYAYTAESTDTSVYTQMVLDELDKATGAFTWFEATMDAETSSVAQEQVQSLLTGDVTAEEYMQTIQDTHDMAN